VQVGNASAVLGFVGAPFTMATYIVEGSSKSFTVIKRMAFAAPEVTNCTVLCCRALNYPVLCCIHIPCFATLVLLFSAVFSPHPPFPFCSAPQVLHALLMKLAEATVTYIRYQAGSGPGGADLRLLGHQPRGPRVRLTRPTSSSIVQHIRTPHCKQPFRWFCLVPCSVRGRCVQSLAQHSSMYNGPAFCTLLCRLLSWWLSA